MKVIYAPGATPEWWAGLSEWQRRDLAAIHRQGKHLRERTDHGQDERWRQAGCVTYERAFGHRLVRGHYSPRRRGGDAHERVLIVPTPYGYEKRGIRRSSVALIDPDTGETSVVEGWVICWRWYVGAEMSANYPPTAEGDFERSHA